MTQAPPPAQPSRDFTEATDAVAARLENEFGNNAVDGHVPPAAAAPPAADPAIDIFDDASLDRLNFDGLQYRDGMALRSEIAKARDRFKPFNDAFGSLNDNERQMLLDSAPSLGSDLATFSSVAAQLHPQDRQWFVQTMDLLARDPQAGAQQLALGADAIRESFGGGAPAPAPQPTPGYSAPNAPDPWADSPDEQPMTRAEFQQWQQEQSESQRMERLQDEILSEVRALGYDPGADVGSKEYDDYSYLLAMAGRPDIQGDLAKADAIVKGRDQAVIDAYVNGKSVDAGRPAVPAIPGGQPASGAQELLTFEDANAAMRARLDATIGPDPRRR